MAVRTIRVGTRASRLALAQTRLVMAQLEWHNPGVSFEVIETSTRGDQDRTTPLAAMGGQGQFTKALEAALVEGTVDIAVHSAKDLPSVMTPELTIAAVPERESPADVWLCRNGTKMAETPDGAVVGTGSPRRRAQLLHLRPGLRVEGIRGNVETRLRKLHDGEYDALIMAHAGLNRLSVHEPVTEVLSPRDFLPAPGQGALVVQTRTEDVDVTSIAAKIDHKLSHRCLSIERRLLARLQAGCSTPIGGIAEADGDKVVLQAIVLDNDGQKALRAHAEREQNKHNVDSLVEDITEDVVRLLIAQGAADLIDGYQDGYR